MPVTRRRLRSAGPEDPMPTPRPVKAEEMSGEDTIAPQPRRSTRARTPKRQVQQQQYAAPIVKAEVKEDEDEEEKFKIKQEPISSSPAPSAHVAIVQPERPVHERRSRQDSEKEEEEEETAGRGGGRAAGQGRNKIPAVPEPLKFPLVMVGSLCLMSMGYSFVREYTGSAAEYVSVTRPLETWGEVGLLASWRVFELALGWYGNFDSYDLAALAVLSHGPTLYLLHAFYGISLSTTLSSLAVEILCTFVPFRLLRQVSDPHSAHPSGTLAPANKEVISDRLIQALTTALAAGIYGVTILVAFSTYLPLSLVLYFKDIPSVAAAHVLSMAPLAPLILVFGLAARVYIFTPTAAQGATEDDARADGFDPVQADLRDTLSWNLWGWHTATKVGIKRTAVAALMSGVHTTLQLLYGIKGVEMTGAVAYASVWVAAAVVTGLGLAVVVGSED